MAEVILALDLPGRDPVLRLLDRLPDLRWVKVGSILMTAEGPALVRELAGRGLSVFLDLKWHDIPNTVAGAVAAAGNLGVRMATLHATGGAKMLQAGAGAAPAGLDLVGVTILTSESEAPRSLVVELALRAVSAGLAGVVCSPLEAAAVRSAVGPGPLIVVPGIRRPEDGAGDQRRIAGPREAARAGATHLVVGRPILEARDPAGSLAEFLALGGEASTP
jgi:orotidine-5'-phosphate decarboxylase